MNPKWHDFPDANAFSYDTDSDELYLLTLDLAQAQTKAPEVVGFFLKGVWLCVASSQSASSEPAEIPKSRIGFRPREVAG